MRSTTLSCLLASLPFSTAATYYFDGSASSSGNGGFSTPFNSLAAIKNLSLGPGDNVLLKRGTHFNETLQISASGSSNSPITVGAYGDANSPLPIVTAKPSDLNSVLLGGGSYVTLQDLEITNPGDNSTARRGVYVYAQDSGEVKGVTLRRLYIHDVQGRMPSTSGGSAPIGKYAGASGGIIIEAAGNSTPTYFTNMLVEDNVLRAVSRQGIYTWSNWCRRYALAAFWNTLCFQDWHASTGLRIRNNRLFNVGGDGIVITGNQNAVTSHNRVHVFNLNSGTVDAGIWTANSDGGLFQYNVVSGGKTTKDGMSYDVDHSTSGTVFEYNVSHDNEGGFFLLCPYDKPTSNFTIRYNLSVNDQARVIQVCNGNLVGGKFYKNTVQIGDGISSSIVLAPTGQNLNLDVLFTDNIIRKSGSGKGSWSLDSPQFKVKNNLFYGPIDTYSGATGTINQAPGLAAPGLRDPNAYRLLTGYPTLGSAVDVAGDAAQDFFGNPSGKNMGFYSGQGTSVPQWISDFEKGTTAGWTTATGASVVADPAGDAAKSVSLASGGKLSRSFQSSSGGVRLDVALWFKSAAGKAATVSVGTHTVTLDGLSAYDVGYWQILEVTVGPGSAVSAKLDGKSVTVKDTTGGSSSDVVIAAGDHVLYVDDIFLVSL